MLYQILPNVIFILAIFGIILLVLRKLPQAAALGSQPEAMAADEKLGKKGLPTQALSKLKPALRLWLKKIWNFVLEAKDLKPAALPAYKFKKIFRHRQQSQNVQPQQVPTTTQEVRNERYYLDIIKKDPKKLENYDALGKFYVDTENYNDGKDVYLYLTNHQPTESGYHARLAFCMYQLKNYDKAVEHYRKSLSLDSTHPNRYYNLGLSLEAKGDHKAATDAFSQAIALEPGNRKFYSSLANAYNKLGETEKAQEALKAAQDNKDFTDSQKKVKIS